MTSLDLSALSEQRRAQLQDIVRHSETLLALAETGDWPAVESLEVERRAALQSFFSSPTPTHEAPQIAAAIKALSSMNERLVELVRGARDGQAGDLRTLGQGRRAINAYSSHSR